MYRILNDTQPKNILELGLGQSSKMLNQYVDYFEDSRCTSIDHNKEWVEFFQQVYTLSNRTHIKFLELENTDYKSQKVSVYKGFKQIHENENYDLIVVDGPYQGKQFSRIDILGLLDTHLSASFAILFDDANSVGVRNTIADVEVMLKTIGREYRKQTYFSLKDVVILCSVDKVFLTTL